MSAPAIITGSIRRRLTVRLLAAVAALTVILFFVIDGFARQLAEESQDDVLGASATSILDAALVRGDEITVDLPYSAFSMLSTVTNDRVFYRISEDGRFLTGYDALPVPARLEGPVTYQTAEFLGESVRIATAERRLSVAGAPVTLRVSVAQTRQSQERLLAQITRSTVLLGGGFFVVAALLAVLAAQSTVTPLRRLAGSLSRRGPRDLRPIKGPVPAEVAPTVNALNQFMERLGGALGRSEDFIAEAGHRVRTPLATVRTQAEITLRRVDKAENRASLREMIRAVDESSRAAGQLLDHAMVALRADQFDTVPVDLAELARETVDRLRPLAELRDIDLALDLDGPAVLAGDPILLQNALGNLLDNAVKYSPSDSQVRVSLTREGQIARLAVSDDGPGLPQEGAGKLTERFQRGSNVTGVIGSGLGLTIAKEVALVHGGTLEISDNTEGPGACFALCLPLP